MHIPRILLAAASSGSGKTTIACGLLQALADRGIHSSAWKCGPDYIDPLFHKQIQGMEGGNLDSFFLPDKEVRNLFIEGNRQTQMAVIEGVMGYFDGIAGISTRASSYDIARITKTPVILIADCKGSSLSVAASIKGFLEYGQHPMVRGVILNRISGMMAQRLKPMIEELGVVVAGWIPECEDMKLESRHLGLVLPDEVEDWKERLRAVARQLEETVDLEKILQIAGEAEDLDDAEVEEYPEIRRPVTVAVARDEAFCFYYQENLRLLEQMGAKILYFSPLHDEEVPKEASGVLLGGGYPELHVRQLSENESMLRSVRKAVEEGIPLLAECGGFLYLHEWLEDPAGNPFPLVGAVKGRAFPVKRLSRFGYISLEAGNAEQEEPEECLLGEIRGHEFHYWDSTDNGRAWKAKKPLSDRGWECMHSRKYQIVGFPHLYYPSNPGFLSKWLDGCRLYREKMSKEREE